MENKSFIWIFAAWLLSMIATLGSLFFSEIMEFVPCSLCWYQRIAMYPLAIIFLIGAKEGARQTFVFSAPLVAIGWLVALFHNLIHLEIIDESASPCVSGVPCSAVWIEWFGFITIPVLSFSAFTLLGLILINLKRNKYYE